MFSPPQLPSFVTLGFAAALVGCTPPPAEKPKPPPQPVTFVHPVRQTVPEFEEFTGRAWASNTVQVRARVSGYLDSVPFQEGAAVEKGDVIAQIDDRSFNLEVIRAKATVRMAKARIARVSKQIARAEQLIQGQSFTEEEFEALLSERNQAEATLEAAEAALKIAELNVEFTKITAPMSGRIGRRLVDAGNLVNADETVIATVTKDDTVDIYFDVDERTVLRLKRLVRDGEIKSTREHEVPVNIAVADETEFKHHGEVDFVENQLDPNTGTLRFRAEVQNPDRFFTPGMFVRLRFPVGEPQQRTLVPDEAITTDQGDPSVFVIVQNKEGEEIVEARKVTTGIQTNRMRVIVEGLEGNERVVVSGLQRLRPGSRVALPKQSDEAEPKADEVAKKDH